MRLLEFTNGGELCFAEFVGDSIPSYAILSHTWGPEDEEVTYKDLMKDAGKSKVGSTGYNKIQFCGKQAASHGIPYFWVDTCCIDKSSSAELSEAINSMYQWYCDAARCYVYLSDVSAHDFDANDRFSYSRWFTRGWTLQELIAPESVEFFSLEGELLGDKKSLKRQIHEITGIPVKVLQGSPLSQFTVEERMSWAAKRRTKRNEDEAYCLLGIFDIFMPLLYGEGREKAFIRLREKIDKLSSSTSL
ncbi:HET-domain-containing protein [Lepidopterella palustris CBS 459.81]|uniref:HET-domain-containing protein n=1 Tax=Lepidopterella palustris CBS 459.81 TaxID=1314670 RepID=A0A8E2J860_9PEZI|nr:HET-domain-containing protein [Lepidopterella palustris CBS 459.81]